MALFSGAESSKMFSRSDVDELLGTYAAYPFQLEGKDWPTLEHYFQGMKFTNENYQERVRQAPTPKAARQLGRKKRKWLRSDWHKVREVIMTRGIYTRCKTWPNMAQSLLDSGTTPLIENSLYDYFWGCGRDRRGNNAYGKALMRVRDKLREEQRNEAGSA